MGLARRPPDKLYLELATVNVKCVFVQSPKEQFFRYREHFGLPKTLHCTISTDGSYFGH